MLLRLRAGGLKATPQRLAILSELLGDTSHPTAQELFERLHPSLPTMSFATVYNTLDALAREGLVQARSFGPGATRFDPHVAPHDHAVCDACGLVSDLVEDPARTPQLEDAGLARATSLVGFEVRVVERVARGLCAACSTPTQATSRGPKQAGRRQTSPRQAKRALSVETTSLHAASETSKA